MERQSGLFVWGFRLHKNQRSKPLNLKSVYFYWLRRLNPLVSPIPWYADSYFFFRNFFFKLISCYPFRNPSHDPSKRFVVTKLFEKYKENIFNFFFLQMINM